MTTSVRKASFTIGLGVCQDTFMSTKRTRMFHGYPVSGGGIERVFFSVGKQHDYLKKSTMNKTLESTVSGQESTVSGQEVGRRKGVKEVFVIWAYSVVLV
jgi:hypothetical protein